MCGKTTSENCIIDFKGVAGKPKSSKINEPDSPKSNFYKKFLFCFVLLPQQRMLISTA